MKNQMNLQIKLSEEMLRKMIFVAEKEGRTVNNHFLFMLRSNVSYFERTHGKITPAQLASVDISEFEE